MNTLLGLIVGIIIGHYYGNVIFTEVRKWINKFRK